MMLGLSDNEETRVEKSLLLLIACLGLSGCPAATTPVQQSVSVTTPFSVDEHRGYMKPGVTTVKGQAFLRQQGGGVVTCAGKEVILNPATPFYRELYRIARSGAKPMIPPAPPELEEHQRRTGHGISRKGQCDAQGNFVFENIPSGRWMVATEVMWTVGYNPQGGTLVKEIDVPASGAVTAFLTDADRM